MCLTSFPGTPGYLGPEAKPVPFVVLDPCSTPQLGAPTVPMTKVPERHSLHPHRDGGTRVATEDVAETSGPAHPLELTGRGESDILGYSIVHTAC